MALYFKNENYCANLTLDAKTRKGKESMMNFNKRNTITTIKCFYSSKQVAGSSNLSKFF
jgi:hypothetical protein